MLFGSMFYGLFVVNAFKNFGLENIHDDRFLTITGGIGAGMNGVSRFLWASLIDFFGFKKIYASLLILQVSFYD